MNWFDIKLICYTVDDFDIVRANLKKIKVKFYVYAIKRKEKSNVEVIPYIFLFPTGHTNLKKLSAVKKVGPNTVRWKAYRNKHPNVT